MTVNAIVNDEVAKLEKMFSKSERRSGEKDIICCVPVATDCFERVGDDVRQNLQAAYDHLCEICPGSPNPTITLGGRIRIGYRHPEDEKNGKMPDAGWDNPERRINVPWSRLTEEESFGFQVPISAQPEFCCSHELVHPFEEMFLKSNSNEKWNEAFCDCLRVFVLNHIGLKNLATEFAAFIEHQTNVGSRCEHHDGAGRILKWLTGRVGCWAQAPVTEVKAKLETLIQCDMQAVLGNDVRFGQDCECKPPQTGNPNA